MTAMTRRVFNLADERGAALMGVLLLMMIMSALAAALGVSGQTETLVARNHQSATQGRLAAEAGLNRAVEVVSTYIFEWKSHGYATADAAVDGLLANTALLTPEGFTPGATYTLADVLNTSYQAYVMDEDDDDLPPNGRGSDASTLTGDGVAANDEDGSETTDNNRSLVIRAVGSSLNNTTVTLEAVIGPVELPAIVTNGNFTISGNATVAGLEGSVHTNGNLTISGGSASISGDASATGTLTCAAPCSQVAGDETPGAIPLTVPTVRAEDYRMYAEYLLDSTGNMLCDNSAGCTVPDPDVAYEAVVCTGAGNGCRNAYGWTWNAGSGTWALSWNTPTTPNGTYYAKTDVSVSGSPGSPASPIEVTIIAEGSIDISGNPDFLPHTPELLFVTNEDLEISGGIDTPLIAQGQMLAHEQCSISGNPSIAGQLICENAASVSTLVTSNTMSGNPTITYNGGLGTALYSVKGWREIR
jgi:hypothetical protein